MNQTKTFQRLAVSVAAAAALGMTSFGAQAASDTVRLGYVEWDSCVAATNVAKAALEEAGLKVKTVSVSGALLFQGMANGDLDALMCAWLPTTHEDYYNKTKDKLEDLGINMEKADLGLAVPSYVDIKSIPELKDHAKEFGGEIIGIDPGAGLMRLTDEVIKHYDLPMKLVEGTDATMAAVLADNIRRDKPVVVTSWKPHWMWAAYDIRYLDDPDQVYGEPDNIHTIARKGLKEDNPQAHAILSAIKVDAQARGEIMVMDREKGSKPEENAKKWLKDHADVTDKWIAAGK